MRTMKLIALAGVALLAAAPATEAGKSKKPKPVKKTVKIHDNYYDAAKITITPGSTVTWKWPSDVGDTHDVKLTKKPKGAKFTYVNEDGKKVTKKTFQSPAFASEASFKVTGFTKPGKYHLICTFHETEMQMDITVKSSTKKKK